MVQTAFEGYGSAGTTVRLQSVITCVTVLLCAPLSLVAGQLKCAHFFSEYAEGTPVLGTYAPRSSLYTITALPEGERRTLPRNAVSIAADRNLARMAIMISRLSVCEHADGTCRLAVPERKGESGKILLRCLLSNGGWKVETVSSREFKRSLEFPAWNKAELLGLCRACTDCGKVAVWGTCPTCQGMGFERCARCGGTGRIQCSKCGGKGYRIERTAFDQKPKRVDCRYCTGGRAKCPSCRGSGGAKGRKCKRCGADPGGNAYYWDACPVCEGKSWRTDFAARYQIALKAAEELLRRSVDRDRDRGGPEDQEETFRDSRDTGTSYVRLPRDVDYGELLQELSAAVRETLRLKTGLENDVNHVLEEIRICQGELATLKFASTEERAEVQDNVAELSGRAEDLKGKLGPTGRFQKLVLVQRRILEAGSGKAAASAKRDLEQLLQHAASARKDLQELAADLESRKTELRSVWQRLAQSGSLTPPDSAAHAAPATPRGSILLAIIIAAIFVASVVLALRLLIPLMRRSSRE